MNIEEQFTALVNKFKSEAAEAIKESIDDIHSEYLPYVADDTALNVQLRVSDALREVIAGNYEVSSNGEIMEVKMSDFASVKITSGLWDKARDNLANATSDMAKDLKIKSLEDEIKRIQEFSNYF